MKSLSTNRIVCLSDNHGNFPRIPECEIVVHSGDLTGHGKKEQVDRGLDWLAAAKADVKIFVPGNHDFMFEHEPGEARQMCEDRDIILLVDEHYRTHGLNFYGSPWQPWFHDWAFNLQRGKALADKWASIPFDTDVLITHGPPHGILDETPRGLMVGCEDLLRAVMEVQPRLHVFGHIHGCHGVRGVHETLFVNAALCTESQQCINPPVVVHL